MNRIQQSLESAWGVSLATPSSIDRVETPSEVESCHCIFTPLHYERNYAYPLVVWLHGPQGDERQVNRVMPLVSSRNYAAVGPRGTDAPPAGANGYGWSQSSEAIDLAERRVSAAIAAARHWLNIEPSRIFLAGYDAGGTMALRLALSRPEAYAGVLSLGGALPSTLRPLARLHAVRGLKVFLATGRSSQRYPEQEVCGNLRLLHAAGMAVCLRLYPCGDDLTTNMLSDMDRWIMEQIAPQPACQDQASERSGGK